MNKWLVLLLLTLSTVATGQILTSESASQLPLVNQDAKDRFGRYLAAKTNKAYAISASGAWAWVENKDSEDAARSGALERCDKFSTPCTIFSINERIVWDSERTPEKLAARRGLNGFGKEKMDFGIQPTTTLRRSNYHDKTPLTVDGVPTIDTPALRKMIDEVPGLLLIDVLGGNGHETLPGATWLGSPAGEGLLFPVDLARFEAVMTRLTKGDKGKPIVYFCQSYECWLSYNAVLHAKKAGYTNVIWYRGGVIAWTDAGFSRLPSIRFDW